MSKNASPEEATAICPFCEKPVDKLTLQKREVDKQMGSSGQGYPDYVVLLTCSHCKKIVSAIPA